MAKLVYDENGRLLFTKEMKQEYTASCWSWRAIMWTS